MREYPKNLDLISKYDDEITSSPKNYSDSMVIAVILVVTVRIKHT